MADYFTSYSTSVALRDAGAPQEAGDHDWAEQEGTEKEAAERAEFERRAKITAEREARARIERERIEAERRAAELEAMRPDASKAAGFAVMIRCLVSPEVESDEIEALLARAVGQLGRVADELESSLTEYLAQNEEGKAA